MARPSSPDKRIRGRRGVALRKRRLAMHPLCAECLKRGITRATDQIDHIIALTNGGEDIDDNVQGLCREHHDEKTAGETGLFASTHPEWLKPSAIPIEIICGPPAAGKTTYALDKAVHGDVVIDLDVISQEIDPTFQPWTGRSDGLLAMSLRRRNAILGDLHKATQGKAWFIVGAPTKAERQWWIDKMGGTVTLLNPGYIECIRRSKMRGTPANGVEDWFKRTGEPWRKQRHAMEGWD